MPLALTVVVVLVILVALDLLKSPLAVVSATFQVKPEVELVLLLVAFVVLFVVFVVEVDVFVLVPVPEDDYPLEFEVDPPLDVFVVEVFLEVELLLLVVLDPLELLLDVEVLFVVFEDDVEV